MEKPKQNVDEVLDKFSMFGRYHLQLIFTSMLVFAYNSMYCMTYIFVTEEIGYKCMEDDFKNNTCKIVYGVKCSKWIYDRPHTFVAEFDLACQEWKRALVGTVNMLGYMLGLLMVGPLSDRIGRKKAVIVTSLLGGVIGLAKSFSYSYWMYIVLECLNAMFGDSYSPTCMLILEIVSAKKRVIYLLLCGLGSVLGSLIVAAEAYGIPYWRHFLQTVHVPALLFIVYIFIIDESPRWILAKGKPHEAVAVLEKIGKTNKVILEKEVLNNLLVENEDNISFLSLIKITVQSRTLLQRCLICIIWWITCTFVYYGTMINSVSLEGNKYLNYALLEIVCVPSNFLTMYVLEKYKRRNPLICSFFAAAALFLIHPFLPKSLAWLSITIYMVSKIVASFSFSITYIYTSELFPTYTRNSMHAMCSSIGRIGAIIAPQTPLLMAYWTHFPTVLFGGTSLVAGVVTFLVPDTADDALPDTVLEAENIGVNKKQRNKSLVSGIDNLAMTETNY